MAPGRTSWRYIHVGVAAQVLVVVLAHFMAVVLLLAGVLGTLVAFAVGVWFGATAPGSWGRLAGGGLAQGLIGSLVAVGCAVLVGDQPAYVLTYAPLAAGVTGLVGAVIGRVGAGPAKAARAPAAARKR